MEEVYLEKYIFKKTRTHTQYGQLVGTAKRGRGHQEDCGKS